MKVIYKKSPLAKSNPDMSVHLILILLFLTALPTVLCAQARGSLESIPSWAKERPSSKYFTYYYGIGQAKDIKQAKRQAISDVLITINQEGRIQLKSKVESRLAESSTQSSSGVKTIIERDAIQEILTLGETSQIQGLQMVEDYWREERTTSGNEYQYWILMRLPKSVYVETDLPFFTYNYGLAPVWRSVLVPGWGQYYKGHRKKGSWLLGSEAFLAASFFTFQHLSQSYSQSASNERDTDRRKFYNDWADRSYTISTLSGIAAGILYVYNVFDAVTTKGEKRYAIGPVFRVGTQEDASLLSLVIYF